MIGSVLQRSNDQWIEELASGSPHCDAAVASLQQYLSKGLLRAFGKNPNFSKEDIDDFVQDATMKIIDNIDSFKGKSKFTTWAMKIAINVTLTQLRRKEWKNFSLDALEYPQNLFDEQTLIHPFDSPEEKAMKRTMVAMINRAVKEELTPIQREVMIAAFYHHIPLTEIAHRKGSTKNALYKIIHDARMHLRELLKDKDISVDEILALFLVLHLFLIVKDGRG